MSTLSVQKFRMNLSTKVALMVVVAVGAVSLNLTFNEDPHKGWTSYLLGTTLFLGLGLCGLFFTAIQHMVSAKWSTNVRRVMEAMAMTLPIAALLAIGIWKGVHHLYEWSHAEAIAHDPILQGKSAFLSEGFFGKRLVIYFVIWILTMIFLVRNSLKQDASGDEKYTLRNRKGAALCLIGFALSVSMAGFDLLMSLEPHWFSTMFGIHFFAAFFQSGLAMMIIFAWMAYRQGALREYINADHFYELGKFLFGFSVFWGYIAFSEFLLIWYANLPEETFFYIQRMNNGWDCLGLAVLVARLFFPLLVILPYGNKRNFKVLIPTCFVILLGHFLEMFWIIKPSMRLMTNAESITMALTWKDFGVGFGFFALFALCASFIMERIKLVPVGDPFVGASTHHHV